MGLLSGSSNSNSRSNSRIDSSKKLNEYNNGNNKNEKSSSAKLTANPPEKYDRMLSES